MNRIATRPLSALLAASLLGTMVLIPACSGRGEPKPGGVITNSIGTPLVYVPPGEIDMGSPKAEQGAALAEHKRWTGNEPDDDRIAWRRAEGPEHLVKITKGFYLGVYEVTQREYEEVMGKNPSHFSANGGGKDQVKGLDTGGFPVEGVTYEDAVAFCETLSALPAETKAGRSYRPPTEAEWEYACRGGATKKTAFHYGGSLTSKEANFKAEEPYGTPNKGVSLGRTCKVGSYEPNGFGLYDMHGNVWEWCSDWYDMGYYKKSPKQDPQGPQKEDAEAPLDATGKPEPKHRVLRGGSWGYAGRDCRSARRNTWPKPPMPDNVGLRVVMVPTGR